MTDAQKCLGAIPRVFFPQKAGDRVRVRYAEPPLYILPENKDPVELSLILGVGGADKKMKGNFMVLFPPLADHICNISHYCD